MHPSRVHVRVPSLLLSPHSPLPPEAKLLQVTFPVTKLAVVPYLTLGRRRPSLRTGRRSPLLLGNLGCGSRERVKGVPQPVVVDVLKLADEKTQVVVAQRLQLLI